VTVPLARASLLRLLLTAAILAYLAARIDMREAAAALTAITPAVVLAVLALVAVDRLVMIWRWLALLRSSHKAVRFGPAAHVFLVSSFVGSFLPAGVGADVARAYSWGRQTANASEAIASVAVDRLLGMLSIVGLGLLGLLLWVGRVDPALRQTVALLAALVVLGAAGIWWADAALRAALPASWHDGPAGRRLMSFAEALGRYRRRPVTVVAVAGLSIVVQLLRIGQAYLLGVGIGIDVAFGYYLVFMPIGLLMLLLPVSVGGFGLPQGVIVWLLRPLGVPDAQSFALSTLIVLTGLAGNLPGAWLYVRGQNA
jgi:uncharacterized membrane protein YbhN (UPF0104 family)